MFKKIYNNLIIAPHMFDKWLISRNDTVIIFCAGHINLKFQKEFIDLNNSAICIHNSAGSLTIKNNENSPIQIFSVHFEYQNDNIDQLLLKLKEIFPSRVANLLIEEIETITTDESDFYISKNKDNIDPRLIKLHRYIRKNYCSKINLHTLSKLVDVHPTYLSNTYNKVFNISPILHINTLKIEKAKKLICTTDLTIYNISKIVGSSSLPQFCSLFKRFTSMTPNEYRQKYKT